ncbi:phage integrase [Klebsiella pneumoniae]|nr:phage integrase [Klebsiella pneumoniae]
MVRRYAHLAPNHLTEHARKIDAIFGASDTNYDTRRKSGWFKTGVSYCFLMARPTGFEPVTYGLEESRALNNSL